MAKSRRYGESPVSYTADEAQSDEPIRIRRAQVGEVSSELAGINSDQSGRQTLSNAERRRAARQRTARTTDNPSPQTDTGDSTASTMDGSTPVTKQPPSSESTKDSKPKVTGRKTPPRKAAQAAPFTVDDEDGKARTRTVSTDPFDF